MCVHDENGAVGIGIGHIAPASAFARCSSSSTSIPGDAPDCAVHHGGPVEPGRGFVLHSIDWGGQDTITGDQP